MVTLADSNLRELGAVKNANISIDLNEKKEFSVQIARCNWSKDLTFSNLIYIEGTEYGGIIGSVLTDTTLDYVEVSGMTWRGRMEKKIIQPPSGSDYKIVSGELHAVMRSLIDPEFDGMIIVSGESTGVTIGNYQFERYCTLLDGITKMLKSKGYKLQMSWKRTEGEPGYLLAEAVPIVDYSDQIELSRDCKLNYTMEDIRDGVNHLIVAGKGELQDRTVMHLYVQPDGSIGTSQYYTGINEISEVYDNTSTETEELRDKSEEKLQSVMNRKIFKMDIEKLGINVGIGDIVGGRDYLTGMYMAKPVENIVYEIIDDVASKTYKLEGENE